MKRSCGIVLLFASLALVACNEVEDVALGGPDAQQPADDSAETNSDSGVPLPEGEWRLVGGSLPDGPIAPVDEEPITLEMSEGILSGWDGCNSYRVAFEATNVGEFTPEELLGGDAGCVSAEVEQTAARYSGVLMRLEGYELDNDSLRLTGPGIELRYERG